MGRAFERQVGRCEERAGHYSIRAPSLPTFYLTLDWEPTAARVIAEDLEKRQDGFASFDIHGDFRRSPVLREELTWS